MKKLLKNGLETISSLPWYVQILEGVLGLILVALANYRDERIVLAIFGLILFLHAIFRPAFLTKREGGDNQES